MYYTSLQIKTSLSGRRQSLIAEGKGCHNPFRGLPPYVKAGRDCNFFEPLDQLQKDNYTHNEAEQGEPLTNVCVNINGHEYTYNNSSERYLSSTAAANFGYYVGVEVGWEWTIDGDVYSTENPGLNPTGLFCSGEGNVIIAYPCDKVPEVDPIDRDCMYIRSAENSEVSTGTFTLQPSGVYIPVFEQQSVGLFQYNGNNWTYTVGTDVYNGPSDNNNPFGLYVNSNGKTVVTSDCSNVPEEQEPDPVEPCIEITLADDSSLTGTRFNFVEVTNSYQANDAIVDGEIIWSGSIWIFTRGVEPNRVVYNGPSNINDARGYYTNTATDDVFFIKTCGPAPVEEEIP
jgi:hypothetical protein